MTRREFLKGVGAGAALAALAPLAPGCVKVERATSAAEEAMEMVKQTKLPRWRGFNVHNMYGVRGYEPFEENDFAWMAEWGFDFVRIPVSHVLVIEEDDPARPVEGALAELDRGIELARKHGLHANVDLHTAPGYAYHVSQMRGDYNLWKDEKPQEAFYGLWRMLAKRYQGIGTAELSFNLINEPATPLGKMTREEHGKVIRRATAVVREVSPERTIIIDGMEWASEPCPELADLEVAQSYHYYAPHRVTHYQAEWDDTKGWPEPVWPGVKEGGKRWDRKALEEHFQPWVELAAKGVGVHCGEGGVYNKTPHGVALGWLRDVLDMVKRHNMGYGMWNFRGPFGVLDSKRADVEYEDFHGHKLDRKMLLLLQEF